MIETILGSYKLHEASLDESRRQDYLDVLADEPIKYCTEIIYDPNSEERNSLMVRWMKDNGYDQNKIDTAIQPAIGKKSEYHAGIGFMPEFIGKIKEMPLFVGRKLFTQRLSHDEVRHALQTHEAKHIDQQVNGFSYFDTDEFRQAYQENQENQIRGEVTLHFAELEANLHSLQKPFLEKYDLRREYIQWIVDNSNASYISLTNALNTSQTELEREYIQRVLSVTEPTR